MKFLLLCSKMIKMSMWKSFSYSFFFKEKIYLERREGREKERDTSMCERIIDWLPLRQPQPGTSSSTLPGFCSRVCPSLLCWGNEPVTFCFAAWHSIHWTIPARAYNSFFMLLSSYFLGIKYSSPLMKCILVPTFVKLWKPMPKPM